MGLDKIGNGDEDQIEVDPTPLDISERVKTLFANPNPMQRMKEQLQLHKDLNGRRNVTLIINYTTLEHAKFIKTLLTHEPPGGNWQFSIRATESQMKEAANIFASGVDWIQI